MNFSRDQWKILSVTSMGTFMAALNTSIINISLPSITSYYGVDLSLAEWVIMIYLLLLSCLLLIYGRLGDMYGHKTMYVTGFTIFALSSLMIVWSPNIYALIFFRGIQALGAAMVVANVQAVLANNFPVGIRGRAIGFNSMIVSLGLASGPSLGGILVNYFSWTSIFWINLPIGIIGSVWAWRILPVNKTKAQKFDLVGAGIFFASQMCLLLALSHGQNWGWGSATIRSLMAAALFTFILFLYWENRTPYPMLRLRLFKNRVFSAASLAALLNYLAQYSVTFIMPFYLIDYLSLPIQYAGLVLTAFPIVMMITSPVSGYWADRIGSRALTALGMTVTALATYILSTLTPDSSLVPVIMGMGLVGLGTGLFLTPNNTSIMSSVPKDEVGIGSGMIATMRSLGQVMGVAVSGAILTTRMAYYSAALTNSPQQIFILAQRETFWAATVFALLGMAASLVRGSHKGNENPASNQ